MNMTGNSNFKKQNIQGNNSNPNLQNMNMSQEKDLMRFGHTISLSKSFLLPNFTQK